MVLDQIAQKIDSQYWGISLHLIGWQGGLLIVLLALMKLYPSQFSLKFNPVTLGWRSVAAAGE